MAMKNPPQPGGFIRTEIIEAAGLTPTPAATALSSLLNSKADLCGEMTLRIEKALWREDGHADAYAVVL
jgi:antitoxin HigA-1